MEATYWSTLRDDICEEDVCDTCPLNYMERCCMDEFINIMHSEYEEALWQMGYGKGWEERYKTQCQYEENKWKESH